MNIIQNIHKLAGTLAHTIRQIAFQILLITSIVLFISSAIVSLLSLVLAIVAILSGPVFNIGALTYIVVFLLSTIALTELASIAVSRNTE